MSKSVKRVSLSGVIGSPVAHSLSPAIHNFWIRRAGLSALYAPLHVEAEHLAEVLRALPKAGFVGVNVTTPHKPATADLCHELSARADRVRSVNTVTFDESGRLHGDSTDGYGFLESLRSDVPEFRFDGAVVSMLGASGAAWAVVDALLEAGAVKIRIANRTAAKAEALAELDPVRCEPWGWPVADAFWANAGLLINGTTIGMSGGASDESLTALPPLPGVVATDFVYAPLETPFLSTARTAGATIVDGLGMLLHQARPGFARWNGVEPTVDVETRAAAIAAQGATR